MTTTAELLANEIERRARGDIAAGSPEDLTEALNRWAAILRTSVATTSGDDRGRQALAFDRRPDDAAQIDRAVNDLRALADPRTQGPAKTEAGELSAWLDEQIAEAERVRSAHRSHGHVHAYDVADQRVQTLGEVRARLAVATCPTCAARPADLDDEQAEWRHEHCGRGCPGHWTHPTNPNPATCGGAS